MNPNVRISDAPSAQPLGRKARETRAAILSAAARQFSQRGYADCTLREIALEAGMKAGSVYYHFPSKDDILLEVLNLGSTRLRANVEAALAGLSPDAPVPVRLRTAIRAHITSFLDVRDDAHSFMRIYEGLPPDLQRRRRPTRLAYLQLWHGLIEEGIREGSLDPELDARLLVPFLLQALNRIQDWFRPAEMTIESICRMIDSTVLRSILFDCSPQARSNTAAMP